MCRFPNIMLRHGWDHRGKKKVKTKEICGIYPKESRAELRYLCAHVHSSITSKRQKVEAIQLVINR